MAIHKPGPGDYADRMTVVLLKLEKTLGQHALTEAQNKSVVLWLEELQLCIKGVQDVSVEHIFRLNWINRTIWKNEDLVRDWIHGKIPVDGSRLYDQERQVFRLVEETTRMNDERAHLVAVLNGVQDKVRR